MIGEREEACFIFYEVGEAGPAESSITKMNQRTCVYTDCKEVRYFLPLTSKYRFEQV